MCSFTWIKLILVINGFGIWFVYSRNIDIFSLLVCEFQYMYLLVLKRSNIQCIIVCLKKKKIKSIFDYFYFDKREFVKISLSNIKFCFQDYWIYY